MTCVLFAGPLANKPLNAGNAWVALSWIHGLLRQDLDVHFVEQIATATCIDFDGFPTTFEQSLNLEYFRSVVEGAGLAERSTLVCTDTGNTYGRSMEDLRDLASSSGLLVNVSGHLDLPALSPCARLKAYIDLDPGYTQIWHQRQEARTEGHNSFFSVGLNVGRENFTVPTADVHWQPVRQPVVLDQWPLTAPPLNLSFSTIASWRGAFGTEEYEGVKLGLKVHEFRKYADVPKTVGCPFEIALDIHPADEADRQLLSGGGWHIVDPHVSLPMPSSYRSYVQQGSAEFSVAQGIYVTTRCGWFSDRSVRYLASGRPVIVQDTGFDDAIPSGEGIVVFHDLGSAIRGCETVAADYDFHAQRARELAEELFDADRVLPAFLERTGANL